MEQLFEAIFLPGAVYVRDLFLWQGVIILMYLKKNATSEQNIVKLGVLK